MKCVFVFDLDNTFYDYEHSHSSGLKKVFESQNIYQSYQDFISAYHEVKTKVHKIMINNPSKHSKLVYFKNMFSSKLKINEIIDLEAIYWESFIDYAILQKEAINILETQKNSDFVYYLFTNQNLNIQFKKINSWKLNFFDAIITSEEVGYEKPNPKFFQYVNPMVNKFYENGYKIITVGDDFKNDIEYWMNEYDAEAYLIDNNRKNIKQNKGYFDGNLDSAVYKIFNLDFSSSK